jgi:hypothetical protein
MFSFQWEMRPADDGHTLGLFTGWLPPAKRPIGWIPKLADMLLRLGQESPFARWVNTTY